MQRINDVQDYIITAFLLLVAIGLMVNRHDGGLQNMRKVSVTVLSFLEQPLSQVRVYRQAISTNTYLHRQNILLQDELSRLRSAEQQNEILRNLLNLREQSAVPLIPVSVVSKDLISVNSSMTISAGSADSVEVGMPVIDSNGLVGQVIITDRNFSQVLPYSNSMFRVSGQVENSRAYGIVTWSGESNRELMMLHVPETIEVTPGEIVSTSSYSNQYPPGIPIGEVTRVESGQGIETQTIFLRAYSDLFTLAEAFVMDFTPDTTIINLNETQQELF
jgi:rod shape-determining protein MreC